jgi:signal transduction histidine kinase
MLREFLADHREELIERTRTKVAQRLAPRASNEELEKGVPLFLDQLVETLRLEEVDSKASGRQRRPGITAPHPKIGESAAKYGAELLRMGFMVAQVVHGYGDVCQAVTELAAELKAPISLEEFHTLNRCLDDAIAGAVTEYARQREQSTSNLEVERLGFLAHELRNSVSTAMLSYQMLRTGSVGIAGSTGEVLGRSLMAIRALTDRTLAEVRLEAGIQSRARVRLIEVIEDIEASATLEAQARGVHLTIVPVDQTVLVNVDRQILASAATNLLQNAFKFTRRQGHVWLRTRRIDDRILIEVEDECGGLPAGIQLFKPFQRGTDQTGMGLGLVISRQGVQANGGDIHARNMPEKGCIFAIDLPVASNE